jgi:hypothetical protein
MEELIGKSWGRALKKNKGLVHIDLSANHFSEEACRYIGIKMVKNRTIYGFHLAGNCPSISVDSQGFVVLEGEGPITEAYIAKMKTEAPEPKKSKEAPPPSPKRKLTLLDESNTPTLEQPFVRMDGVGPVVIRKPLKEQPRNNPFSSFGTAGGPPLMSQKSKGTFGKP